MADPLSITELKLRQTLQDYMRLEEESNYLPNRQTIRLKMKELREDIAYSLLYLYENNWKTIHLE